MASTAGPRSLSPALEEYARSEGTLRFVNAEEFECLVCQMRLKLGGNTVRRMRLHVATAKHQRSVAAKNSMFPKENDPENKEGEGDKDGNGDKEGDTAKTGGTFIHITGGTITCNVS